MKYSFLLTLVLLAVSIDLEAAPTVSAIDNGNYHLGAPERGKTQVTIEFGEFGGNQVMAVAACKSGCIPAVYTYQKEESRTLDLPVYFNTSGLYVIRYDANSFIIVQPDGMLGRQVWKKLGYSNIYSKNTTTAQSVTSEQIQQYALKLSERIMSQETGGMAHESGIYHLAAPRIHLGKAQTEYRVEFQPEGKKHISLRPCETCPGERYELLPEETAIAGVDVYRHSTSHYLFDLKDGVLLYTFSNAGGLGRVRWDEHSKFNVLSSNKAYIRQVLKSAEKQKALDKLMNGYFTDIKREFEKRAAELQQQKTAQRTLPQEGLQNARLKTEALQAAKDWAGAWRWQETLKSAYFTSRNWSITRNSLSGVITGRNISGVVTMTHPDGRCRFQYMSFRQEHDGHDYSGLHTSGIGPIYDIPCERL